MEVRLYDTRAFHKKCRAPLYATSLKKEDHMKKILATVLSLLFVFSAAMAQNANSSSTTTSGNNSKPKAPRKPPFRANKDQVKQAQKFLKERGFYSGEE